MGLLRSLLQACGLDTCDRSGGMLFTKYLDLWMSDASHVVMVNASNIIGRDQAVGDWFEGKQSTHKINIRINICTEQQQRRVPFVSIIGRSLNPPLPSRRQKCCDHREGVPILSQRHSLDNTPSSVALGSRSASLERWA